jgi:MFS family permease
MFQFGFCLASWNNFYVSFKIRLGKEQWQSWYLWGFTAFTVLGAMISSIGTGYLMPFGKWKLFHLNNLLLIFASSLSLIECIPLQMACRFFYGMAAGAFTVMVPKFINETAPQELKGPYGALSQISITVGIFVCALLGLPVPEDPEDGEIVTINSFWVQNYWRVVWSIPIFLALLQSTLLFFVFKYDTPFKLKKMGQF